MKITKSIKDYKNYKEYKKFMDIYTSTFFENRIALRNGFGEFIARDNLLIFFVEDKEGAFIWRCGQGEEVEFRITFKKKCKKIKIGVNYSKNVPIYNTSKANSCKRFTTKLDQEASARGDRPERKLLEYSKAGKDNCRPAVADYFRP